MDGYISDVAYPALFHREMTPAWIDAVARALGCAAPDIAAPFRWCELGCGAGLNSLVSAATCPQGDFLAVDMDAAQIGEARRIAAAAALSNITFLQAGFEELAALPAEPLGCFDIIVTHGVLSWISPAQRAALHRFIDRCLKPGGLVYVHYMAQPGMAAAASAQHLVRYHASMRPGGSATRAAEALAFLRSLSEAGAGFFTAHPQERQRLEAATRMPPAALAHEWLTEHWEPFHVARVMEDFAALGCLYRGSATPLDNIDAASLPQGARRSLVGVADPALAETLRDFARNQSLRRDLYQRGGSPLSSAQHALALEQLAVTLLPGAPSGEGDLTFETPGGPVIGEAALFGPLLRALQGGPRSLGELARLPGFSPHPSQLNQAVQMLLWSGCLHPVARPLPDPAPGWRLNHQLAARPDAGWLAAPALGTALPATATEIALARAVLEGGGEAPPVMARAKRDWWVACGALPTGRAAGPVNGG
ncbi:class I SAM-dependent methyltransferase [Roseomonas sp. GC11]|uniref:class I SAM-dependent methyltransferase n=1 Tax=Roseomonas sp. GC11 TaxID=2950546 RepID=UPI002109E791|nr:class I SAM-dependent methyltransferase [Roseomonas sp. GC11]MCQ4160518.1 class I SAM-dependent methyltransferase [Roseomonas sp. GC11]